MEIEFKQIGNRLAQFRKKLGLSQKELAELAGVNRVYLAQIETGRTNPSFNVIYNIYRKYALSIDWLLSGNGSMTIDQSIEQNNEHLQLLDFQEEFIKKLNLHKTESQKKILKAVFDILNETK